MPGVGSTSGVAKMGSGLPCSLDEVCDLVSPTGSAAVWWELGAGVRRGRPPFESSRVQGLLGRDEDDLHFAASRHVRVARDSLGCPLPHWASLGPGAFSFVLEGPEGPAGHVSLACLLLLGPWILVQRGIRLLRIVGLVHHPSGPLSLGAERGDTTSGCRWEEPVGGASARDTLSCVDVTPASAGYLWGRDRFAVVYSPTGESDGVGFMGLGAPPLVFPPPIAVFYEGGVLGPMPAPSPPTHGSSRKSVRLVGRPLGDMLARASSRKALLTEGRIAAPQVDPCISIKDRSALCGIHLNDAEATDLWRRFSASS